MAQTRILALRKRIYQRHQWLGIGVALGFIVVLAVTILVAPMLAIAELIAVGFGIPLLALIWRRAEFGLLGLLFLTSSFVPADIIDIRLPIGGLKVRDLTLLLLTGLLIVRGITRRRLDISWWPVSAPLLAFLGIGTISLLYGILFQEVETNWAFSEFRSLFFYATMFITAWAIEWPKQLRFLLIGLFLLADLTCTVIVAQQFLGTGHPLLVAMGATNWKVWQADAGVSGIGTVRVIPPGHVLMYMMTVVSFCLILSPHMKGRTRAVLAFQFVFLNMGMLLTYTRGAWIATGIAFVLCALALPFAYKLRLASYTVALAAALGIGYLAAAPAIEPALENSPFFDALSSRFTSILTIDDTLDSNSLEWRIYENEAALEAIASNPLIGVGLGGSYRDVTLLQNLGVDRGLGGSIRFTRFVHNSFLYIGVKMGILGLLAFGWFCIALLVYGWREYRVAAVELHRHVILAILASFIGLLIWSIPHAHLLLDESTVVVGLAAGLIACIREIELRGVPAGEVTNFYE